jgi:hypothetical protein
MMGFNSATAQSLIHFFGLLLMPQELKVITVKLPLHCPDCAVRVKEVLLENKSNLFLSRTVCVIS